MRHMSGSTECSAMKPRCGAKNGFTSGGRPSIARAVMNRCTSSPQLSSEAGAKMTSAAASTAAIGRMQPC